MTGLRLPSRGIRAAMLCAGGAVGVWLAATPGSVGAQPASAASASIYTCVTADGRRLTADRPIDECRSREQRVLNRDGSLRAVVPPTLTAEEAAEADARARAAAVERAARADAQRRDRNLLARYPDEASHQRARVAAADTVRAAIRLTEQRVRDLAVERKPLANEAEFYVGKPLPAKLKGQLDANDAAVEAQRSSALNQQAELDRINRLYDAELERLRRLWAGAPVGSLGALPAVAPVPRPASPVAGQTPAPAKPASR
jgi:hypothetical protein